MSKGHVEAKLRKIDYILSGMSEQDKVRIIQKLLAELMKDVNKIWVDRFEQGKKHGVSQWDIDSLDDNSANYQEVI